MSNAVSALSGASSQGFAPIVEAGLRGMITLRGDFASAKLQAAVKSATGLSVPDQRHCNSADSKAVAWMSPDELLVMVPYTKVITATDELSKALASEHALAVNVSDARAVFTIEGAGAREVLAKLSPVDLSRETFTTGMFRRTRLAQAPVAFWLRDDATFELICFRSEAQYVFDALSMAAMPGSEVGIFTK